MRSEPIAILVMVLVGCVGVPSGFSPRSAASLDARPAPVADATTALREDPPLPGSATEGWTGLARGLAPPSDHARHVHAGGSPTPVDPPMAPPVAAPDGAHDGH